MKLYCCTIWTIFAWTERGWTGIKRLLRDPKKPPNDLQKTPCHYGQLPLQGKITFNAESKPTGRNRNPTEGFQQQVVWRVDKILVYKTKYQQYRRRLLLTRNKQLDQLFYVLIEWSQSSSYAVHFRIRINRAVMCWWAEKCNHLVPKLVECWVEWQTKCGKTDYNHCRWQSHLKQFSTL
jgi:hypothetical protein